MNLPGQPGVLPANTASGALVTRPVPVPEALPSTMARRWELFAPVLQSCVIASVDAARRALLDDAEGTLSESRRSLSFHGAREIGARQEHLPAATSQALLQLFSEPNELAASWRSDVGSFALHQLSERLTRSNAAGLDALGRRLHGAAPSEPVLMAERLAGLLNSAVRGSELSNHARNVLCTFFARHLESVLPGLAGLSTRPAATAEAPVEDLTERRSRAVPAARPPVPPCDAPRPVLEALRALQLEALEQEHDFDAWLCSRVRVALAAERVPYDVDAAERALGVIETSEQRFAALEEEATRPPLLLRALRRLRPVMALVSLRGSDQQSAMDSLLAALTQDCMDLESRSDPRTEALDEICGDVLACYRGETGELQRIAEETAARMRPIVSRQQEIRQRARSRALADRRRNAAKRAADAICERLSNRPELRPFIAEGWHAALVQAHIRFGADSAPWRRMLALGQSLLTAGSDDLAALRPALADALGMALAETMAVEQRLDALQRSLEQPADPTVLPSGVTGEPAPRDLSPLPDARPWLLADGRRRWLLVQPRDGDGEVLMADARAQKLQWYPVEALRSDFDAGRARLLTGAALMALWMAPDPG